MPATYTIDQTAGVVRVECTGMLTNPEMLDCIEQVYSDPARQPGMPAMIDWRGVQGLRVTPQGLEAAATLKATLIDPQEPPTRITRDPKR